MSIPVRCQCGKAFAARDELAGKRVKCPSCGGVLAIPAAPALQPLDDDPLGLGGVDLSAAGLGSGPAPAAGGRPRGPLPKSPLPKSPSRRASDSQNQKLLLICAGVGGGAILLLLVLLVGSMLFSKSPEPQTAQTPPAEAASSAPAATPTVDTPPPAASVSAPATPTLVPATPDAAPAPPDASAAPASAPASAAGPVGKKWQVQPDPPPSPVDWPGKLPVNISVPYGSDIVLYPDTPSPFVALGLNITGGKDVQLWNVLTQKKVGQLEDAVQSGNPVALSADGRYLAVKSRDSNRRTTVELWSFQTGKLEREIECDDPKLMLGMFEFLGSDRLVSFTSGFWNKGVRHSLRFWDVASGNQLHDLQISDSVREGHTAVSPGGRYFAAMAGQDKLTVYESSSGQVVGAVDVKDLLHASPGVLQGLEFSPDSRQLALVYADTDSRVLLLDVASGTLADTIEMSGKSPLASAYGGAAIEWMGDRGWCLFGGTLVDRTTRRVVWNLSLPIIDRLKARRTLADGWIVSTTGAQNRRTLRFIPIPWDKIDASLAALRDDAGAPLKPDMSVSLSVRVDKLRFGDPAETSGKLADFFRQRFEGDGVRVEDGQPIVLSVAYGESEGETLYERQGIAGPATGRTVQATNVNVKMELKKSSGGPALWQHEFSYSPKGVTIFGQQATDATTRDAILRQTLFQLAETPVPYFVPSSKSLSPLPGVTEFKGK